MSRYAIAALLTALLAAGLLAGCGSASSGGSQGDGKSLTIYSGRDREYVQGLIALFQKENPDIDVKVRYGDTAELAATIREEGDRSPADLFFSQDAGSLGALQDTGLLSRLPSDILDRVPAEYRSPEGYWVGTSARVRVLAYDSRKLSESQLPRSVFDLTRPEWKGKVGWAPTNASFQAFITAMRLTAGEEKTLQWLEAMKANDARPYDKNSIIRDAIANGEIDVGLINHYYVLEAINEEGVDPKSYPVKIHFFPAADAGSLINISGIGILESAGQKGNAEKFTSFVLSRQGQEYFARKVGEYPLVPGVRQDPSLPPLSKVAHPNVDLTQLSQVQQTVELLQKAGVL